MCLIFPWVTGQGRKRMAKDGTIIERNFVQVV